METVLPIVLVLGPTAAGKTALAVELARRLPQGGECVCADSMQVYRGMDIGTAKPSPEERAGVPHHLLDLLEPEQAGFSVDAWLALAEEAIAAIRGRGRWPSVVGGTGLYVQALLGGLLEGPAPDPALRRDLAGRDLDELRERLQRADPEAARRIHRNDRRRTVRALEVFETSGHPLSTLQTQWGSPARRDVLVVGLDCGREAINRRINARVRSMVERGLVEEARALWEGRRLGPQAAEALGYKQLVEHFEGRRTLPEAIEQVHIRTRRLAKQQRAWLRRFRLHPASAWFHADQVPSQDIVNQALAFVLDRAASMPGRVRWPPAGRPSDESPGPDAG